jgi:hypothetical protein
MKVGASAPHLADVQSVGNVDDVMVRPIHLAGSVLIAITTVMCQRLIGALVSLTQVVDIAVMNSRHCCLSDLDHEKMM